MAGDNFTNNNGFQLWNVPSNWSNGLPVATSDVTITGPSTGNFQITLLPTDPAFTVQSLSFTTLAAPTQALQLDGTLTVTGNTSFTTADLFVRDGGAVTLGGVTTINTTRNLAGFGAQVEVGELATSNPATLSIATLQSNGNNAVAVFQGGTVSVGVSQGSTTFTVNSGTLNVGSTSGTDTFMLVGGTLSLATRALNLADVIEPLQTTNVDLAGIGYQPGETARVTRTTGTAPTYTVAIQSAGGQTLFTFNDVQAGSAMPSILLASDGAGGTLATVACYVAGTAIATPSGQAAVETLRAGDLVVTAAGEARPVAWMGWRSYAGRFLAANPQVQPIRFRAGSLGNRLPMRDLLVSPEHAMLLDGVLVAARHLVNGRSVVRESGLNCVYYHHVELDAHDLILAEGAPSETFVDDGSRAMFHNAADYEKRNPSRGYGRAVFCASRVEEGEQLDRIKRGIDMRAGLWVPGAGEPLRGAVDGLDSSALSGWAQTPGNPETPVVVEVLVDQTFAAQTIANVFRADLRQAGLGSGRHGFSVQLPAVRSNSVIEVRRAADGWPLGCWTGTRRRVAA